MNKFWVDKAYEYSEISWSTNRIGTHPNLLKAYNKHSIGKTILDFGCGDGSLIEQFSKDELFCFYDKSLPMLEIAEKKYKHRNIKIFNSINDFKNDYFDVVFLSMVLVCIDDKNEIFNILETIKKIKKKDGFLIIANGHPCFRNYSFSDYYTDFLTGNQLDYFQEGQPHDVTIRSSKLTFTDYNWSLSFIINNCIRIGFNIEEIIEYKDNNINNNFNKYVPPSIIYVLK